MSLTGAGFSGTFMLQMAATIGGLTGGYLSDRIAGKQLHRRMLFQALCYFAAAPFLAAFLGTPAYGWISVCIFSFSFLRPWAPPMRMPSCAICCRRTCDPSPWG